MPIIIALSINNIRSFDFTNKSGKYNTIKKNKLGFFIKNHYYKSYIIIF